MRKILRYLCVKYSVDQIGKLIKLKNEIKIYQPELKERDVKVKYMVNKKRDDLFQIDLIGYDGTVKYRTNKWKEIGKIIHLIDKMPMERMKKRSIKLKRIELYTNAHKKSTIKGLGFKDEKKANETIKILRRNKIPKKKQFLIINLLYYRAKYHPNQTKDMRKAMRLFKKWIDSYKKSENK